MYAWGRNDKGQLGTKEGKSTKYSPKEVKLQSERLVKVAAGWDFSLGLTAKTNKVLVWGNYRYNPSDKTYRDIEEPIQVKDKIEQLQVIDI